jgi:hypothetical protein
VTDGWELGLEGWTNGVPNSTVTLVESIVGHGPGKIGLQDVPGSWRRWNEVGCLTSVCVANGSLSAAYPEEDFDSLTPHFTGGSQHASISADNCTILGDVWGTDERPGSFEFRNVSVLPDPWVDKYLNGPGRLNSSELLEALGFRWDYRRRDWLKPLRRVDGSVVYVLWHETRYASDGVRGGIPGTRADYPMFHPVTGRRIHPNETSYSGEPQDFVNCEYLGLSGDKARVRARLPTRAMRERMRSDALARTHALLAARAKEVERESSWRTFNRDPSRLEQFYKMYPPEGTAGGTSGGSTSIRPSGGEAGVTYCYNIML